MSAAVLRRLGQGAPLGSGDERRVLADLSTRTWMEGRSRLACEQDAHVALFVHEGMVQVYRTLSEGGRQTTALLLPGDMTVVRAGEFDRLKLDVEALAPTSVSMLPLSVLRRWRQDSAALDHALQHVRRVEQAIAREWLVSLGARTTLRRTAHLFCELRWRIRAVEPGDPDTVDVPLNQVQLGQTLSVSAVHINRVLGHLREAGIASLRSGQLSIQDRAELERLAGFSDFYLTLGANFPRPQSTLPSS